MKIDDIAMSGAEFKALMSLWKDLPDTQPDSLHWDDPDWAEYSPGFGSFPICACNATLIAEAALVRWLLGKTGRAESRSPEVDDGAWTVSMGIGVLGVGSSYLAALIAAVRAVAGKESQ